MSVAATPLRLDTTACNRCGRCAPLCKPKALRIGPGYIYVDWDRCDGCGKCADACDTGAISLREGRVPAAPAPVATAAAGAAAFGGAKGGSAAKATRSAPAAVAAAAAGRAPDGTAGVQWSLAEAGLVVVVAFALLVGVQVFASFTGGAQPWSGVANVVYDAAILVLLWYLARRRSTGVLAALRLDLRPEWSSLALAPLVGVVCWLFAVTYRAAVQQIGFLPAGSSSTDLTAAFGPGVFGVVLTIAVVAVLGPLIEEAMLRGVLLGAVRPRIGAWPAIVLSAVVFALLHASVWSLLPLTVLGVGLGWLAARSRSLWPAILAHVVYNAVLLTFALLAAVR
jgi:membrane protease YdiL (CAAX protease family)/NAD-dependent dihydropyrimidine dehydrogenase PreA subunit